MDVNQIKQCLQADPFRMEVLKYAASLNLNDWCIGAGFVRNLVWDHYHGFTQTTSLNDIDVIYFDSTNIAPEYDKLLEEKLNDMTSLPWSVKNQARMHLKHQHTPYQSTLDAMSYWVECETAIGARFSSKGELEIISPFELASLSDHTITMNQRFAQPKVFRQRIEQKQWLSIWPKLVINE
ncbi:nucleotidyltransferase family protein [Pleionea sp. CnH1-48]|uniref:nucleotidyltransferase family protein n=1 Tax=Pleionea sp. CnH1-48 TaxID=2954494 RepID=UPI002097CAAA|nr:nucleotidyltransferase family protein [Pleionea sp. CnH1-48]MCO7226019.1 nucleotidyltransferase family protein [Pleionea sp. CnH1-48]